MKTPLADPPRAGCRQDPDKFRARTRAITWSHRLGKHNTAGLQPLRLVPIVENSHGIWGESMELNLNGKLNKAAGAASVPVADRVKPAPARLSQPFTTYRQ